jgi:putative FmdB family regulatory protein
MPFYAYACPSCGNTFEKLLKIADRDTAQACTCGTQAERQVEAPMMSDPVRMGRVKPDSGFREVLHKIHEKNPGSKLNQNPYF